MKARLLFPFLSSVVLSSLSGADSSRLSDTDAAALVQQAESVQRATQTGDIDKVIRYTHPAILKFFPSREQFEATMRKSAQAITAGITVEKLDWSTPTPLYESGTEEVTFLPRTMIMKVADRRGDKRVRVVSFLIAARQKGTSGWLFLDSEPLRNTPSLLWVFFPSLPKDVTTPPNKTEILD